MDSYSFVSCDTRDTWLVPRSGIPLISDLYDDVYGISVPLEPGHGFDFGALELCSARWRVPQNTIYPTRSTCFRYFDIFFDVFYYTGNWIETWGWTLTVLFVVRNGTLSWLNLFWFWLWNDNTANFDDASARTCAPRWIDWLCTLSWVATGSKQNAHMADFVNL